MYYWKTGTREIQVMISNIHCWGNDSVIRQFHGKSINSNLYNWRSSENIGLLIYQNIYTVPKTINMLYLFRWKSIPIWMWIGHTWDVYMLDLYNIFMIETIIKLLGLFHLNIFCKSDFF